MADDTPVEVDIFDLSGRSVRRLVEARSLGAGRYQIQWDGRDGNESLVPPGIYYARLQLGADIDGASVGRQQVLRAVSVAY